MDGSGGERPTHNVRTTFVCLSLLFMGCPGEETGDTDGADTDADTDTAETGGSAGTTAAPTGASTSATGGEACTPGELQDCVCPDGSSSDQICLSDGNGYSACDCVGGATDPTTGADSGSTSTSADETGSGGSTTGPPPECDGAHPLVEGDLRYCEKGNCYCGDFTVEPPYDVCYPMDIAEPCCPVEVVCY